MIDDLLRGMPVTSTDALAEWLCIAFMGLKDNAGLLVGGRVDPGHAHQIAQRLVDCGVVTIKE